MDYQDDVREVNLKSMLFAVLYQWKKMLMIGVVLALALGGFQCYRKWRQISNAEAVAKSRAENEAAMEAYEDSVAMLENTLASLEEDIESQKEYLEKSVLMQIDANNVHESDVSIYLSTDYQIMPGMDYQNVDKTKAVQAAYMTALTGNALSNRLSTALGMENKYLRELVSVSADQNGILNISVCHTSIEASEQIMNRLLNFLPEIQEQVTESICENTYSVVFDTVGTAVDQSLVERQERETNRLLEMEEKLTATQEELQELKPPAMAELSTSSAVKSGIKWAILGGVAGVLLVCFGGCVCFICTDRVYSAEELNSRFGLKILGSVCLPEARHDRITRWLSRKEGRLTENSPKNAELILENVRNYCKDAGLVLVSGDLDPQTMEEKTRGWQEKLPEVRFVFCGNLTEDPEALRRLPECDGILLVPVCNQSRYSRLAKAIERVADAGKTVIGCVVVEA